VKLHEVTRQGAATKRVGRGTASGSGKTAGRGSNGQKSRSGHHAMPAYFEGGQMPLTQRLPKLRGFKNPVSARWATVTLRQLESLSGTTVNLATLREVKIIDRRARYVKVVGRGTLTKKLNVKVDRVSAGARQLLEKAGATITLVGTSTEPAAAPAAKSPAKEPTGDAG